MIDKFEKQYRFLSNFYRAPIEYQEKVYPSAEHLYQALKTEDEAEREKIRKSATPGDAKRFGKKVTICPDWEESKDDVMEMVVNLKFTQNPELAQKLVDTGEEELVEGNWWGDTWWGVCNGEGQNKLGKILMGLRTKLNKLFP